MTERERFDNILRETGRRGIENVLFELDKLGFYSAPASTRFHGSYPGGLLKHSLNVCDEAMMVLELQLRQRSGIEHLIPVCSIAIAALLHDVCKAEVYRPEIKKRKNALGVWESYDGYGVDYSNFPLGHEEKSVIRLLQWGLQMTDDEIMAIRWHMAGFDLAFQSPEYRANYGAATERCPLLAIIKVADGLAAHILEAL